RTGDNEKAVALYEPALIGLYHDNEDIIKHLAEAYYNLGRYGDVIKIIPKVTGSLFFSKSRANLFYAMSLEKKGNMELAEKEFKAMNHRFSNYESRYHYVKFLLRSNRKHEAEALMKEILNEDGHMSRKEKENDKIWIDKVKVEWKVLQT
ncbi:MAG: hypothetical protein ABIQ02_12270, partial [Saprospiraceae bacterium]